VDVGTWCGVILHSAWLLPVLAAMIALDGPLPVLPSETVLLAALTIAIGERDVPALAALFVAAAGGSVAGDLTVFGLGRTSQRVFIGAAETESQLAGWVRRNILCRPGVTMVGARFVPAGRLVSTAAAGRYGLPLPVFLSWSVVSSSAWALYMTLVAMLLNPLTDGSPLSAVLAGIAIAILTGAVFATVKAVQRRRPVRPAATTA